MDWHGYGLRDYSRQFTSLYTLLQNRRSKCFGMDRYIGNFVNKVAFHQSTGHPSLLIRWWKLCSVMMGPSSIAFQRFNLHSSAVQSRCARGLIRTTKYATCWTSLILGLHSDWRFDIYFQVKLDTARIRAVSISLAWQRGWWCAKQHIMYYARLTSRNALQDMHRVQWLSWRWLWWW